MLPKRGILALTLFALIVWVPVVAICSDASETLQPIRIPDAIHGIHVKKRTRFIVADIRVGATSVKDIFSNSDTSESYDDDYLSWKEEDIVIKLKEERFLSRFSYLALTNDPAYLTVYLVDPKEGGLARWFREHLLSLSGARLF